jgi:hypothetical protein
MGQVYLTKKKGIDYYFYSKYNIIQLDETISR